MCAKHFIPVSTERVDQLIGAGFEDRMRKVFPDAAMMHARGMIVVERENAIDDDEREKHAVIRLVCPPFFPVFDGEHLQRAISPSIEKDAFVIENLCACAAARWKVRVHSLGLEPARPVFRLRLVHHGGDLLFHPENGIAFGGISIHAIPATLGVADRDVAAFDESLREDYRVDFQPVDRQWKVFLQLLLDFVMKSFRDAEMMIGVVLRVVSHVFSF